MKKKKLTGFMIIALCLIALLAIMFVGGYVIYESQNKDTEVQTTYQPVYHIQEISQEIKIEEPKEELLPDLAITGFYPEKLNDGSGNVVMKVVLKNKGYVNAHNVAWTITGTSDYSMGVDNADNYFYTKLGTGSPYIDVSYENPINTMETDMSYEIKFKFNPDQCPVTIGFFIDPNNTIKEESEKNNIKSLEIKGCDEEYTSETDFEIPDKYKKVVYTKTG